MDVTMDLSAFDLESIPGIWQEFVDGFLTGAQVLNTPDILTCTNTTRWYIENFDDAWIAFAKGNFRQGWSLVSKSFIQIYPLTYSCWHGFEDLVSILAKNFDLKKPWILVDELAKNFPEIRVAIGASWKQFFAKQYAAAGNTLGAVFYSVFYEV